MPVTARLSKAFYDALGEQVANELVDWFNQVDLTYRTDLRELNDLNFARFDARVGERLAELRAEMNAGFARADAKLEERLAHLRGEMEGGFARADAKLEERLAGLRAELEGGFARADAKLEERLAGLRAEVEVKFAQVDVRIAGFQALLERRFSEQSRWLFALWLSLLIPIIGLWMRG